MPEMMHWLPSPARNRCEASVLLNDYVFFVPPLISCLVQLFSGLKACETFAKHRDNNSKLREGRSEQSETGVAGRGSSADVAKQSRKACLARRGGLGFQDCCCLLLCPALLDRGPAALGDLPCPGPGQEEAHSRGETCCASCVCD